MSRCISLYLPWFVTSCAVSGSPSDWRREIYLADSGHFVSKSAFLDSIF
jgi:hypothetical protein